MFFQFFYIGNGPFCKIFYKKVCPQCKKFIIYIDLKALVQYNKFKFNRVSGMKSTGEILIIKFHFIVLKVIVKGCILK